MNNTLRKRQEFILEKRLTAREAALLDALTERAPPKKLISQRFDFSLPLVKKLYRRAFIKLGVTNRVAAALLWRSYVVDPTAAKHPSS